MAVGIAVFLLAVVVLIGYGRREASRYIDRVMVSRGINTHPAAAAAASRHVSSR